MPIYEYQPSGEHHCAFCQPRFDRLEKMNARPLDTCPRCGAPVQRIISAAKLAKASPSLNESNLERHGFTQYRKTGKGEYQKTVGTGPDVIKNG